MVWSDRHSLAYHHHIIHGTVWLFRSSKQKYPQQRLSVWSDRDHWNMQLQVRANAEPKQVSIIDQRTTIRPPPASNHHSELSSSFVADGFLVAQHHDWPMFSATVDRSKKPKKKKTKQKNNASETSTCTTSTPPKQETSLDGHQYAGGVHNMCQNENENVK